MKLTDRATRSSRVFRTAAQIYLGYKWRSWRDRRIPSSQAERRLSEHHRRSAERILAAATDLKGMIIKLGQVMGARADVLPEEYIEVLSQLHDAVPPHPYPVIRDVIEEELGKPVDELFAEFSQTPIAAASLAQVHRARLDDGRTVAVKVQYPEIAEIVDLDLQNIRLLVRIANRFLRDFDFTPIVEELAANVPLELDFINEGHNAEETARNFAGSEEIVVPGICWEYSTRRVLTMEFVEGVKITDTAGLDAAGIDRQAVARLLANSYVRQIFAHGFFHADPHPGNLFVQPGPRLVIVDFGLAKKLEPGFVEGFTRLLMAIVASDGPQVARSFRELGFETRHDDDAVFDALGEAMVTRLSRNAAFNQDRQLVIDFQRRMMRVFRENPVVRVPVEFFLLGRVMGLLAGVGAQLGSPVNLLDMLSAHVASTSSDAAG